MAASPSVDSVDREVAWLSTSGDGLPALLAKNGGPWQVIQAYWPRTPVTRQTSLYLQRATMNGTRESNQRRIEANDFRAKLRWPIGSTTTSVGLWEAEQRALDAAIALVLARIYGYLGDHTHGNRFLSVAEAPTGHIAVHFDDPEHTASQSPALLSATITYSADERDFTA